MESNVKRAEEVRAATAVVLCDGDMPTKKTQELLDAYINGTITLGDLHSSVDRNYGLSHLDIASKMEHYEERIQYVDALSRFEQAQLYYWKEAPSVMANRLHIFDEEVLRGYEDDIVNVNMMRYLAQPTEKQMDYESLLKTHEVLFKDVYVWAGQERLFNVSKGEHWGDKKVSFADWHEVRFHGERRMRQMNEVLWDRLGEKERLEEFCYRLARMWQVHPFREGNTRTTMAFGMRYAEMIGLHLDLTKLFAHAKEVRNQLVQACAGDCSAFVATLQECLVTKPLEQKIHECEERKKESSFSPVTSVVEREVR